MGIHGRRCRPTRNSLLDAASLAAPFALQIRPEVDEESSVVAPLLLASTSSPIWYHRREEP
jgi:hypothetical protein